MLYIFLFQNIIKRELQHPYKRYHFDFYQNHSYKIILIFLNCAVLENILLVDLETPRQGDDTIINSTSYEQREF